MDAALKQRLVGAAVLVALAVIFLTMLVGGPEPETDEVSVPLESPAAPERDFETRDLPLTPPSATPAGSATAPADDPNRIVTVETPSTERVDAAPETTVEAAVEAARLRLRPILMTSFAFIMGVVPLVLSTGAGSEMRNAMGIAVFFGMLGVTFFGLFLTPVFYVLMRALEKRITGNVKVESHA